MGVKEDKAVLLEKLMAIQDAETAKPPQEMDAQLVCECSAYILELDGEAMPTDVQLEEKQEKLLRKLFGDAKKPHRVKGILRKVCIAAVFLLLVAALSVAITPLSNGDETLLERFGYYLTVILRPGESIDFGPETLQNLGACVEYASVEEFVCETNADILVPTEMPEGYFIKSVSLTAKSEKVHQQVVFVTNAPARVSVSCTWNKGVDDVYRHSCRRIEQVGQYLCYFTVDPGKKQCNFTYKGNEYILTADSYADLYRMIANMKGSLEE